MNRSFKTRRASLSLVAALAAATIAGHLLTSGTSAVPVRPPGVPAPGALAAAGGADFVNPGASPVRLTAKLDRTAVLAGGDGVVKMELVLAAEERPSTERTPTDFVVVLDRSGSMDGVKIEQARAAVRELISQLAAEDRFALVTYASRARLSIPLSEATERSRQHWRGMISAIRPGGGTNMSGGLDLALQVTAGDGDGGTFAGRAGRLILISDGLANEGDPSVAGLSGRARRAASREMVVSTVGVGADFNELVMSAVADAGTGNYYYLRDVEQLAAVFADELGATRETVASAVAVAIETGDDVRVVDAAGYPLEHADGKTIFRPGSLFSGQERRIWVTFAVANDTPGSRPLGTVTASYKDQGVTRVVGFADTPVIACVSDEGEYHGSFDRETWARAVAEEDYNRLQQRVAAFVKERRRGEALREIERFRVSNQAMNRVMQRQEIARKLEEVRRLQTEVEDAFEGTDQLQKQNRLAKSRQAEALDGRRAGSKRSPSKRSPGVGGGS